VLGQPENQRNKARDFRLPTASELFPELLNPKLDKKDRLPPCSALEALEPQEPFVEVTPGRKPRPGGGAEQAQQQQAPAAPAPA